MPWKPEETAEESFRRAMAAFKGDTTDSFGFPDRKMLSIVASANGADARITPDGFTVLWPHRREPWRYLPSLAPPIVAALREHAPNHSFAGPFEVDEHKLRRLGAYEDGPRWFWVVRVGDLITIACRDVLPSTSPSVEPEPLAPWMPSEKVFAYFAPLRLCAYCRQPPESFRLVDDALICTLCGRSEAATETDLASAQLKRAG